MSDLVVDASVAIKWVVPEPDTAAAMALSRQYRLLAPDLLLLECANTFWKKVRRNELTIDEALISARGIEQAGIEFIPIQDQTEAITRLSLDLNHPAYDCAYIAIAQNRQCRFATADRRLIAAVDKGIRNDIKGMVVLFTDLV